MMQEEVGRPPSRAQLRLNSAVDALMSAPRRSYLFEIALLDVCHARDELRVQEARERGEEALLEPRRAYVAWGGRNEDEIAKADAAR